MSVALGGYGLIALFLFAHMLGDFVFQSNFLATNKGKDGYILFVHSFIWTFCISIVLCIVNSGAISIYAFLFLLITHMLIDLAKSSGLFGTTRKALYFDQFLHALCIIIIYILL